MAEGFVVSANLEKGRHLVATRAFRAGQLILEQSAYAAVLYDEQVPGRCDFCFSACESPLTCGRSKLARYCSREHQRVAWGNGYRQECDSLVKLAPRVPPPTVRLAARALWRRQRVVKAAQPERSFDSYESIEDLLHHWDKLDDDRKSLYAQMAVVTLQYLQGDVNALVGEEGLDEVMDRGSSSGASTSAPASTTAWPSVRDVALLLARFAANNHTICDQELRPIGVGIYPLGALINHSCAPNAMQSFIGSKIQFRAVKPIKEGDEITIAYTELAATRQERRETLAHLYFFDSCAGWSLPHEPKPHQQQQHGQSTSTSTDSAGRQSINSAGQCAALHSDAVSTLRPLPVCSLPLPCGGTLHVYCRSPLPPWPTDPHDQQLTQIEAITQAPSPSTSAVARVSSSSSSSSDGKEHSQAREAVVLQGGLHARVVPRNKMLDYGFDVEEGPHQSGRAGASDATALAQPLAPASLAAQSPPTTASSSRHAATPTALGMHPGLKGSPTIIIPQQQQEQTHTHDVEVDAWGPWVAQLLVTHTANGSDSNGDKGAGAGDAAGNSSDTSGVGGDVVLSVADRAARAALLLQQVTKESPTAASPSLPAPSKDKESVAKAVGLLRFALKLCGPATHSTTASSPSRSSRSSQQQPQSKGASSTSTATIVSLGACHILRARINAALMKACIDVGEEWGEALRAARAVVAPYRLMYPSLAWPNMALHLAALCKLEMFCGDTQRALQAADSALALLAITHGHLSSIGSSGGMLMLSSSSSSISVLDEVRRIQYEASQELMMMAQQRDRR